MVDPDGDTQRFANVASILLQAGLCPPTIHMHNPDNGTMIISDLGTIDFAQHLQKSPQDAPKLYAAATDVLGTLHGVAGRSDQLEMTHDIAAQMISLASDHYAQNPRAKGPLHDAMRTAFNAHVEPQLQLCLRDYHAQNLIWRPDMAGTDRVGLLDFQDACMAPLGYDLMSLIRDARRDVEDDVARNVTAQYCQLIGRDPDEMSAHLACVGVQRNLRILGIFARLTENGRQHYAALIPRVWRYLMMDLSHPELSELRTCVQTFLPAPTSLETAQ